MARLTGGQAIVKSLITHGVDTVFALPGVQLDHLFNAFFDERNAIRVIHPRHEQGAAYMAYGYARASRRPGVCAVVPGPGLLNASAALATAYACNTPVLCISGQIPSTHIDRGFGLLHEIPDQLALIRHVTKWAARANHPAEAPAIVREAFRQLRSGRPRPVEIEMAMDIMADTAEVEILAPAAPDPAPALDPEAVERAAQLLADAKRPLIFVGGGISGAEEALLAVAEALQAPVSMSRHALGALSDRHPLAIREPIANKLWAEADVVLAVGTRLTPMLPSWGVDDGLKVIRIDIDPVEVTRAMRPAIGIVADATAGLKALALRLAKNNRKRPARDHEVATLRAELAREAAKLTPQIAYLRAMREALPEDGILVEELTQVGYCARFAWPVYRPNTFISTGYQGTLGFGFATALGAKIARPETPVLAISGDGGFMYNVQELATAVQQKIGVVVVIFRDDAFGNVQRMQLDLHGGKVIGTDLHNPDFVRLAEVFGAHGLRARTPEELTGAIRRGFATAGPTLIEVPIGAVPDPWHLIQLPRVRGKRG